MTLILWFIYYFAAGLVLVKCLFCNSAAVVFELVILAQHAPIWLIGGKLVSIWQFFNLLVIPWKLSRWVNMLIFFHPFEAIFLIVLSRITSFNTLQVLQEAFLVAHFSLRGKLLLQRELLMWVLLLIFLMMLIRLLLLRTLTLTLTTIRIVNNDFQHIIMSSLSDNLFLLQFIIFTLTVYLKVDLLIRCINLVYFIILLHIFLTI